MIGIDACRNATYYGICKSMDEISYFVNNNVITFVAQKTIVDKTIYS